MSSPKPTSPEAQGSPKRTPASLPPPVGLASPKAAAAAAGGKVDKNAQKAAKAAKRAAAKGLQVGEQAPAPVAQQQGAKDKGGKPAAGGGAQATKAAAAAQASGSKGGEAAGAARAGHQGAATDNTDPLQLFLHLDLPSHSSQLSHSSKSSTSNIHPSIIRLALQYSEFKIVGANARCIAMLEALKDIISSYTPPAQTNLTRHLPTTHLNPQISHLIRARPLSVSMGTAIRYLKYEISLIDQEMDVEEAKSLLLLKIDSFIRDRILLAGKVIEQHAIEKIQNGDTILTYARSSVVEGVLLEAKKQGKEFSVVVVDSRPLYEGKNLLTSLRSASIPTTYVLLSSLSLILPRISLCFLGTHALLSNGSMFSRAGTAMVAMMLKEKGVPVVCCCETYKFSERIMLDSIVGNEMASPASLLSATSTDSTTPSIPSTPSANLSPLSLLYDVSRPEDVTVVITEAGLIPVQSVPVLLRDYKPLAGL
ncbi:initiation factor 2 subunit family-domain-containing protein [Leucosporidium creatinivorum]|uniref:Translation initiation factor eIF2B subunit delta n=1 Tax=Leucosporidium creatinivorum TaxID=106004 RepID=A0A1Y2ENU9_9BASI|nr:initiation factor 2 subunit family-domain-containing protein [Leucosporidium creatinivorum]